MISKQIYSTVIWTTVLISEVTTCPEIENPLPPPPPPPKKKKIKKNGDTVQKFCCLHCCFLDFGYPCDLTSGIGRFWGSGPLWVWNKKFAPLVPLSVLISSARTDSRAPTGSRPTTRQLCIDNLTSFPLCLVGRQPQRSYMICISSRIIYYGWKVCPRSHL